MKTVLCKTENDHFMLDVCLLSGGIETAVQSQDGVVLKKLQDCTGHSCDLEQW